MDEEIKELRFHLSELSRELAEERAIRQQEKEHGLSLMRLHVPLPVMLGLCVFLSTGVAGLVRNWVSLSSHQDDKVVHLDRDKVAQKNGVAYKTDVDESVDRLGTELTRKAQQIMAALQHIDCHQEGKRLTCVTPSLESFR